MSEAENSTIEGTDKTPSDDLGTYPIDSVLGSPV